MNRIWTAFAAFTLGVLGIFALSVGPSLDLSDSHALGVAFTQLTGILSTGMMASAMLLSTRPRWLEPSLNGLDKMYRLHKWLGITAISIGVLHWLTATGDGHRPATAATQPAADAATPAANAVQTAADAAASAAESWLQSLTGPAHMVAEPALFILIALGLVALVKFVPYRWFQKTHILTALIFFFLAFHSVVLMKVAYWTTPIGWLNIALSLLGVVAGIVSLVRYFGGVRRAKATVVSSQIYPELKVLETDLKVEDGWAGHKPGQFAFVTTDKSEGAHPFTIATAWNPKDGRIGFIAKELGDDTANLKEHFVVGKSALVEGPYGCFTFEGDHPRQIWIGAGIGITPFVAKMRELSGTKPTKPIDLFHSTIDVSETALDKMRADANAAGVTLQILVSPRDGRLDAGKIKAAVPDWKSASIWFCGPTGFGASLKRDLVAAGLPGSAWHQELFEMR